MIFKPLASYGGGFCFIAKLLQAIYSQKSGAISVQRTIFVTLKLTVKQLLKK